MKDIWKWIRRCKDGAKYTYSEQLRIVVNAAKEGRTEYGNLLVVVMNLLAAGGLFWGLYRKRGLDTGIGG